VGFLDSLIGRTKLPKSNEDKIFAMSTAMLSLQTEAGLEPANRVGIVFRSLPSGRFQQLTADTVSMLKMQDSTAPDDALKVREVKDDLGFEWLVVDGADFEAILAGIHAVAMGLLDEGLGDCLLAAVFPFNESGRPVYWIYGYKEATFYPFVPNGDHRRDNASEMRLAAVAKNELPVEPDLERWYALWGVPV
jgi:hypothetical protein